MSLFFDVFLSRLGGKILKCLKLPVRKTTPKMDGKGR